MSLKKPFLYYCDTNESKITSYMDIMRKKKYIKSSHEKKSLREPDDVIHRVV